LYQGEWAQFANGQTLTGGYVLPTETNNNVANVTLRFHNTYSATLTLPNEQIQLIRFAFGATAPVLSSFSPAAAQPEALLSVNGTGFDPNGVVTLTLADTTGYSVNIPASSVSASSVKVAVPPYIVASSNA